MVSASSSNNRTKSKVPDFKSNCNLGTIQFYEWLGDSYCLVITQPDELSAVDASDIGLLESLQGELEEKKVKTVVLTCKDEDFMDLWLKDVYTAQELRNPAKFPIFGRDGSASLFRFLGYDKLGGNEASFIDGTVRGAHIIGPDKKIKYTSYCPSCTGHNLIELIRVVDSLQLNSKYPVATPTNWRNGYNCVVLPAAGKPPSDCEDPIQYEQRKLREIFPKGVCKIDIPSGLSYIKYTPQPIAIGPGNGKNGAGDRMTKEQHFSAFNTALNDSWLSAGVGDSFVEDIDEMYSSDSGIINDHDISCSTEEDSEVNPLRFYDMFRSDKGHRALIDLMSREIIFAEDIKEFFLKYQKLQVEFANNVKKLTTLCNRKMGFSKSKGFEATSQLMGVWNTVVNEAQSYINELVTKGDFIISATSQEFDVLIKERKDVLRVYVKEKRKWDEDLDKLPELTLKPKKVYKEAVKHHELSRSALERHVLKGRQSDKKGRELKRRYLDSAAELFNAHNCYVLALQDARSYCKSYEEDLMKALYNSVQQFEEAAFVKMKSLCQSFVGFFQRSRSQTSAIRSMCHNVCSLSPKVEFNRFAPLINIEKMIASADEFQEFVSLYPTSQLLVGRPNEAEKIGEDLVINDLSLPDLQGKQAILKSELDYLQNLLDIKKRDCALDTSACSRSSFAKSVKGSKANMPEGNQPVSFAISIHNDMDFASLVLKESQIYGACEYVTSKLHAIEGQEIPVYYSDSMNRVRATRRATLSNIVTPESIEHEINGERYEPGLFTRQISGAISSWRDIDNDLSAYDVASNERNACRSVSVPVPEEQSTPVMSRRSTFMHSGNFGSPRAARKARSVKGSPNVTTSRGSKLMRSNSIKSTKSVRPSRSTSVKRVNSIKRSNSTVSKRGQKPSPKEERIEYSAEDIKKMHINEPWYFGLMTRAQCEKFLVNEGDFLVRLRAMLKGGGYVLSALCKSGNVHIPISVNKNGHFSLFLRNFSSVSGLISHFYDNAIPVTAHPQDILSHPCNGSVFVGDLSGPNDSEISAIEDKWRIDINDIEVEDEIGIGNFGSVYKGRIISLDKVVAIKLGGQGASVGDISEINLLKAYKHPNIVKLIGAASDGDTSYIVMELMSNGNLGSYLKKHGSKFNIKELVRMTCQVAAGMQYLESKNCLHRDLAARNVLVSENGTLKISDFGMCREIEEVDGVYSSSNHMDVPIKWTSPEALKTSVYTHKSDVWSFGILVWEIFSLGKGPYTGMSNASVITKVHSGYRLPKPELCPESMFEIMSSCWLADPKDRPSFRELEASVMQVYSSL